MRESSSIFKFFLFIFFILYQVTYTQTTQWTGSRNTRWNTSTNWTNGVPTINTEAIIPSGLNRYPTVGIFGAGSCKSLNIQSGAKVNSGALGTLTIGSGGLTGQGILTAQTLSTINIAGNLNIDSISAATNSTINLNGTTLQTIDNYIFYNLTINNSSGAVLNNNIVVNHTLTITSGSINLSSHNLTIGAAGSISGTFSSSRMIIASGGGELRKLFTAAGLFTFPVGDNTGTASEYSPASINFISGTFSSAYAGIKVIDAKHPNNGSTANILTRYWIVTSQGISNPSYSITLNYVNADINGTESNIYGGLYNGLWALLNPVSDGTNQITANGLSFFGDFTGGEAVAFPVELTSFTASINSNKVLLNWRTANEIQNYGFDIERKLIQLNHQDIPAWEKIGFVSGNGNSNSPKYYSFTDNAVSNPGTYLYRLKQINIDGGFDYSFIINLEVNKKIEFKLEQNYPNPFNPLTKIKYSIPADGMIELKVYNIIGKEIALLQNEFENAGEHEVTFNGKDLSSGIYFYSLKAKLQNGKELSSFNKMTLLK